MLKSHFGIDGQDNLTIGGISAVELAEKFGTPLYVVDEQRVRDNYRRFYKSFSERWPNVIVCYAYKANSNTAICKILNNEGAGAEVSSGNELQIANRIGVPGQRTVFNGNNKSAAELEMAISNDVLINVDSIQELLAVDRISSELNRRTRIGFRVNPDVEAKTHPYIATGLKESKFGLDVESGQAIDAYSMASEMDNVDVVGIHCHIGSQILETGPFEEEAEKLMNFVGELKSDFSTNIKFIDFGGGLGIPYRPEENELGPERLASSIIPIIDAAAKKYRLSGPTLIFEPGRYLLADASVLLASVGYSKERKGMPGWVAVDAGMNALIRPALYGAYHHIEVANKMRADHTELVNVAGPLCESGDFLGKERKLPKVEQGDLIAVFDVGAYGLAMSNQHTAQPRPAMVLVNSGVAEVVRQRESFEDLTRLDRIPGWMK